MLVLPIINFTGSTTVITDNVGGIFSSFSGVIALMVGVPIAIWLLNVLKNWLMDLYYNWKDNKITLTALKIVEKAGYTAVAPPTPAQVELAGALKTLREMGVRVEKKK